jgi:YggT family protein
MRAIVYIVYMVLEYIFVTAFLLRVLLPLVRANMRSEIAQAVLRGTSPLVMPLRKMLPPIGKIDTSSIVALMLAQTATVAVIYVLAGFLLPMPFYTLSIPVLLQETLVELIRVLLRTYGFALFLCAILSWVAPHTYSPFGNLLDSLCNPILKRLRRFIPPLAGLDFSVFFALIVIGAIWIVIADNHFSPFPFG